MTTKTAEEKERHIGTRGLSFDELQKRGRELCSCGHRAIDHAALKYSCQAAGKRKGFCPCMRFIPANANR
jgi:hypothetical protein